MPHSKISVAVLCGGPGAEREVSLKSGQQVLENLPRDRYSAVRIEIAPDGPWLLYEDGSAEPKTIDPPTIVAKKNGEWRWDIVFIALHGTFGEDGRVQALLDLAQIPYTSSGVLSSAIGMDKAMTRKLARLSGIRTPKFLEFFDPTIPPDAVAKTVAEQLGFPCVVKPNASGSSVGVSIVKDASGLPLGLSRAFAEGRHILIEEYIKGVEASCGVMGNSRRTSLAPMPPIEITPDGEFFDYRAKYQSAATQEICPTRFGGELNRAIQNCALLAHEMLGCDGLTRSDFIVRDGVPYFIEINTVPGLTGESLCPKEARAMGMSFAQMLERMIELGLRRYEIS